MISENIPKQLYFGEKSTKKSNKPIRISQRIVYRIQYALILALIFTTLYAFINFKQGNIMSFFGSQAFIFVALSYVFIYIFWQGITNKLSKFPVEIVKSQKSKIIKQTKPRLKDDGKSLLISIIGYTLSLAFSLLVMIFLAVAHLSGTGETHVIWNHFGEMIFETVLFVCAFIVIIVGYFHSYRLFKKAIKGRLIV